MNALTPQPHNVGELATFDSFAGLIPCKVVKVVGHMVTIKVTARNHPAYTLGETYTTHSDHVWPRKEWQRVRGSHGRVIVGLYRWMDGTL